MNLLFVVLVGWVLLVVVVGGIAHEQGRSWVSYGLLAIVFSPLVAVAVLALLPHTQAELETVAKRDPLLRRCPHCAEFVKREASVCRYCHRAIESLPPATAAADGVSVMAGLVALLAGGAILGCVIYALGL